MRSKFLIFSLASFLLFISCGHKKIKYSDPQTPIKAGLNVDVEWVKNKGNRLDLKVLFNNNSDKPMTINETAFGLTFEGRKGVYKKNGLTYQLGAKQSESVLFHFAFSPPVAPKGLAVFSVNPVLISDGGTKTHHESFSVNLPVE